MMNTLRLKAGSIAIGPLLLLTASLAAGQQAAAPKPPPPPGPAALSVPNPLAGLKPAGPDLYQSPDGSDRFNQLPRHSYPPVFFPSVIIPSPYYLPLASIPDHGLRARTEPPHVSSRGGLALEGLPDTAQVYINGFYVGSAQEFGLRGRPLDLSAGAYRVEVRAQGFEPLNFNALIAPNDIFRYRGDLQPLSSKTTVVVPSLPPTAGKLYIIPNCYAGDKPPKALPPGCDRKNLQTR